MAIFEKLSTSPAKSNETDVAPGTLESTPEPKGDPKETKTRRFCTEDGLRILLGKDIIERKFQDFVIDYSVQLDEEHREEIMAWLEDDPDIAWEYFKEELK